MLTYHVVEEKELAELKWWTDMTLQMWSVFPMVLVVVGTLGNALSIVVLTRPDINKSSMALYLTVLAVSDTVCLYLGVLNYWLVKVHGVDLISQNPVSCKTYAWMLHTFLDLSPWLLVAVTIERVVCVWFPYQVRLQFTRKRSALTILFIFFCLLAINGHLVLGLEVRQLVLPAGNGSRNQTVISCIPSTSMYTHFVVSVWPWLDLCIFSLLPILILVVGSTLIISKVTKSVRKRSSLSEASTVIGHGESRAAERRRLSSLTVVLLSLILVFTLSTVPVSIFLILQEHWSRSVGTLVQAKRDFAWAMVSNIMYLANALNFFMFIICGSRLRRVFCNLFSRRAHSFRMATTATCTTSASTVTPHAFRSAHPRRHTCSSSTSSWGEGPGPCQQVGQRWSNASAASDANGSCAFHMDTAESECTSPVAMVIADSDVGSRAEDSWSSSRRPEFPRQNGAATVLSTSPAAESTVSLSSAASLRRTVSMATAVPVALDVITLCQMSGSDVDARLQRSMT